MLVKANPTAQVVLRSLNMEDYVLEDTPLSCTISEIIENFRSVSAFKKSKQILLTFEVQKSPLIGSKTLEELGFEKEAVFDVKVDWQEEWI